MSRTSDCAGLEAEGDRRLHADAHGSQARRRDPDRQQQADRADLDPRGEAAGAGGRVVSAVGVSLPAERTLARPGGRAVVPALPPGPVASRAAATRTTSSSSRPARTSCPSSTWCFWATSGVEDGQLTTEQCRLLKGLVEHQASGLVFMPGWQGREFSLLETELGDLCPVVLDPAQPGGWGSRIANHFELTELGRRSLLTKLADTQDDNAEVWEGLPGFQWYAPVLRAKAGSDVLCRAQGRVQRVRPAAAAGHADLRRRQGALHGDRRRLAVAQGGRGQVPLPLLGPGGALDGLSAQHGQGRDDAAVLRARPAQAEPDAGAARQRDGARAASRFTAAR